MTASPYTVLARSRPIRVAFLVNTEPFSANPEALNTLLDVLVDWNYTHWGGRTNPIIPFSGSALTEDHWLLLQVADPDCISVVGPITKELLTSLKGRLHPWGLFVNDKPDAQRSTVPYEAEGIAVPPTPTNLRRVQGPASIISGGDPQLLMFEFPDTCDPDVKRFVHRNFGTFHQWIEPRTQKVRRIAWLESLMPKINAHQAAISDPASLAAALTQLSGRIRPRDSRPSLPFIAPCQLSSLDLEVWPISECNDSYQIIIGDAASDFGEFWNSAFPRQNWWKPHERQLWIPSSLIRNLCFLESLFDWLRHYTNWGSQGRRVDLASHSLSQAELEEFRQTLLGADPPVPTNVIYPTPFERERRGLQEALDQTRRFLPWDSRTDTQQFTLSSPQGRFQMPQPKLLQDDLCRDGSWMVDLQIEHASHHTNAPPGQSWWRLPRRNSSGLVSTMFRAPARISRHHRFSVRVESHDRFMSRVVKPEITISLPEDAAVVRWLITQPDDRPFHTSDARSMATSRAPIADCRVSEKGAHLAALISMFGSFWTANSFCERRFWRHLFRGLAGFGPGGDEKLHQHVKDLLAKQAFPDSPRAEDKSTALAADVIHLVRGRLRGHYLTQRDCTQIRSRLAKEAAPGDLSYPQGNVIVHHQGLVALTNEEMQEGLNELLEIGVLRLGVENICPACKLTTWYHVNDLRQNLTCAGCGNRHSIRATERWSYELNTLAQICVSQGVLAVLHALTAVASHAHTFFVFSPSLNLFRPGDGSPWHEVDVLCVANGDFVVGELKEGFVQKRAFDDLAEVAEALLPQRAIIFLPFDHAQQQWAELSVWLSETRSRLAPKDISAEIFTLPEF